jgi:alkylhydroperoxidase family enzyme
MFEIKELCVLLLGAAVLPAVAVAAPPGAGDGPVALPSDEECWRRMPAVESGGGQPLPSWAKAVSTSLPRTAAAMLELDLAQRTKTPLDPVLRAKMRWVIAHANRCAYGQAYALADLKWTGGSDASVKALTGDPAGWPEPDRDPLEFARMLTVAAPEVPDELFSRLRARFGDKRVAAMVLLSAYGNFQDRIVLGLALPVEPGGPLLPLRVKFAPGSFQATPLLPPQTERPGLLTSGATVVERDPEWSELSFDELQSRLERQRGRTPRLPIPSWDEVKKNLPAAIAARPTRIVWNLVCSGYVPELAIPWSVGTRTMWAEAQADRVFEESLFWVQTRSIGCNYCMGHCEMLLEVAGLDKSAVAERTRRLAGDDWSCFPAAEQRAYAYARKLSKTPWELTPADYKVLEQDLGAKKAMATFWWLCRGLYMTRVSDGFQLPLERDNVFADFFGRDSARNVVLGLAPLSNEETWKRLPVEKRTGEPLPAWARSLAGPMPILAANLLRLDHVHRAHSPLDSRLRARMRCVTAHANHCAYAEAYALADAARAGLDDAAIDALRRGDWSGLPHGERAALEFARKMTVASATVTDDEFRFLVDEYGQKKVAAMVILMAYANFQDRLLLCLGSRLEPGGPLPPVEVILPPDPAGSRAKRPVGQPSPLTNPTGHDLIDDDLEWISVTYDEWQKRLERQRARTSRVPEPTYDEVYRDWPAGVPKAEPRPTRILWNLVCSGNQPEMAAAWMACGRARAAVSDETRLDPVFANTLFWVITRSIDCPYCMGHCEMLLEVAGLSKPEIAQRTRILAGDDWSSFPPAEQRAFAFARKLTRAPWTFRDEEIAGLARDFGPERALAILYNACWGNYMTRVSNGFQLRLERDNIFFDSFSQEPAPAGREAGTPAK